MDDTGKTKEQLIEELRVSRAKLDEVEQVATSLKLREAELRSSEQMYRILTENTNDIIWSTDLGFEITYVSPSVENLLGLTPEETMNRRPQDRYPPATLQRIAALFASEMAKDASGEADPNRSVVFELEEIHKNGSLITEEVTATFIRDDHGKPIGVHGVSRDITKRKQAEEALRRSEEKYRGIFDESVAAIYVFDNDKKFIDSNQAGLELLGYTRKELLGLCMPDVDADPVVVLSAHDQLLSGDRIVNYEHRLKPKDGKIVTVLNNSKPLTDADGNVVGMQSTLFNITERKKTEEALKTSEERYRLLFSTLDNPITLYLRDGTVLLINEAGQKNLKMTAEEIVGKSLCELFPDFADTITARTRKIIETGAGLNFEDEFNLPDGKRWFWSNLQPVKDENGEIFAIQIISTEMTEFKKAEEDRRNLESQIQHAQKLESLGVLAGGIAHDFNNLLMGILGNADLALRKISPGSPSRDHLISITQISTRAAELCRQMLAYSGRGSFVVKSVDLNNIVEEMIQLLEVSITKNASLKFDLSRHLPAVEADATQLRQIVMNLITNASEAIVSESGVISISTGKMECDQAYLTEPYLEEPLQEGLYAYLEVADSGCGMDDETLQKIFDPFFSTKFTGRGLGLSAVLGIVRGHGGLLKVHSQSGKGSTFRVLLPVTDRPARITRQSDGAGESWRGTGTILLVDDDRNVLSVARDMLEELGFSVLTARDGQEALAVFRDHPDEIVCVLLDLTMPNMDGEQTFHALRRVDENVQVILSSGYNKQEIAEQFSDTGLAGFIQKPYRLTDLVAKLKQLKLD